MNGYSRVGGLTTDDPRRRLRSGRDRLDERGRTRIRAARVAASTAAGNTRGQGSFLVQWELDRT